MTTTRAVAHVDPFAVAPEGAADACRRRTLASAGCDVWRTGAGHQRRMDVHHVSECPETQMSTSAGFPASYMGEGEKTVVNHCHALMKWQQGINIVHASIAKHQSMWQMAYNADSEM